MLPLGAWVTEAIISIISEIGGAAILGKHKGNTVETTNHCRAQLLAFTNVFINTYSHALPCSFVFVISF